LSTQTGCYTIAAGCPFQPLEKRMTFKDIFPGLSSMLSFLQAKLFSRTYQVIEISKKTIRPFQEAWAPWQKYKELLLVCRLYRTFMLFGVAACLLLFCLYCVVYLLVSWVWWDSPSTWLI